MRFIHGVAAIVQEMMVQVDLYRAGIGAGAAQRRRVGQVLELIEAAQMRSQHASDRAGICGAVGVAAYGAKYRAGVQARAAADAVQDVALLGVGEKFAASVVE